MYIQCVFATVLRLLKINHNQNEGFKQIETHYFVYAKKNVHEHRKMRNFLSLITQKTQNSKMFFYLRR